MEKIKLTITLDIEVPNVMHKYVITNSNFTSTDDMYWESLSKLSVNHMWENIIPFLERQKRFSTSRWHRSSPAISMSPGTYAMWARRQPGR